MNVLWAPWRMAYIGAPKEQGCLFCANLLAEDARAALVLAKPRDGVVMLNRFPYANGHLMVAPRQHTADLSSLSAAAYGNLMEALRRSMEILRREFRPEGMNVGLNLGVAGGAGIADHLHWHIVPRWLGDINYMPMIGGVRVMPEHLEAVFDRLRSAFTELDEGGSE
jgi:ATP adenylyltransferase